MLARSYHTRVRDERAKAALRLRREPVDHVAAVRGAGRSNPLRVGEGALLENEVEALHQIFHRLCRPSRP